MNQTKQILEYMMMGRSITPLEALHKFGCFRLSARIYDIKSMGFNIKSETIDVRGKKGEKYWL